MAWPRLKRVVEGARNEWRRIWRFARRNALPIGVAIVASSGFLVWALSSAGSVPAEAQRSFLTTTVQATATFVGLFFVGLTLVWQRASQAREHIRSVRGRYLEILGATENGSSAVEQARQAHMRALRSGQIQIDDAPHYLPEARYPSQREIAWILAALSRFVADARGEGDELDETLQDDFAWLRFDEDAVAYLAGDVLALRSDPVQFLRAIDAAVSPGASWVLQAEGDAESDKTPAQDLAWSVWDATQDDSVAAHLGELARLERLTGTTGKALVFSASATIALGILALGSGTPARSVTVVVMLLALGSLSLTVGLLDAMFRTRSLSIHGPRAPRLFRRR